MVSEEKSQSSGSKLQQLDRDALLRLLKKQSEQTKTVKAQLEAVVKERDELIAKAQKQNCENSVDQRSSPDQGSDDQLILIRKELADLKNRHRNDLEESKLLQDELRSQLDDSRQELIALKERRHVADVASLELADFEKKVDDLTDERNLLRTQLETAEAAMETLTSEMKEARTTITEMKNELAENRQLLDQLRKENEKLNAEKERFELDQAHTAQLKCSADLHAEKQILDISSQLAESNRRLQLINSTLSAMTVQRDQIGAERDAAVNRADVLQADFDKFKARAKFVLEQQQQKEPEVQKTDISDRLQERIYQKDSEITRLSEELASQTELYSKLNDRFVKTERSADQYRREAMETQIQMARSLDELRDVRATYEQALLQEQHTRELKISEERRSHSTAIEKLQFDRNEEKRLLNLEIDSLRSRLEDEHNKHDELVRQIGQMSVAQKEAKAPAVPKCDSPLQPPHHMLMRGPSSRSEGSLLGTPEPLQVDVPLEGVLFGDDPQDPVALPPSQMPYDALIEKYEQLSKQSIQMRSLLAESEDNNEKCSDQIKILKEEIRRIERNKERETHLGNTEYLKNIFLQFLRPEKVCGEKRQLIPIIKKMLQLSEAEVQLLVEKTAAEEAQEPSSSTGFGALFHRWNGIS